MKELFDRHQAKLTDAEDRRIWSAMHDASRPKRRWVRWGIPAFLTTAAAAVVVVAVVQQDVVTRKPAQQARQTLQVETPPVPMVASNDGIRDKAGTSAEMTEKAEAAEPSAAADRETRTDQDVNGVSPREGLPVAEPNGRLLAPAPPQTARMRAAPGIAAEEAPAPMALAEGTPAPIALTQKAPEPRAAAPEKASRPQVQAQAAGGTIRGRVMARDGSPLIFANVVLLGTRLGSMTDSTGTFVIKGLPTGKYTLKVSYLGYEPEERRLAVADGATKTQDFAMNEATVATMDKVVVQSRDGTPEEVPVQTFAEKAPSSTETKDSGGNPVGNAIKRLASKIAPGNVNRMAPPPTAETAPAARGEVSSVMVVPYLNGGEQVRRPGPPIPVGGSAPVNGRVIDSMFFEHYGVNPFVDPEDDRFATFAVDVDNASFSLARAYLLDQNLLPPKDAIRVEEFVNAFDHHYAPPQADVASREWGTSEHGTFAIHLEASPSPFGKGLVLMRVGLKGREISERERKPASLTFVVDVSGSMGREDRLGLVKRSLRLLLDRLDERDDVSLVVYGSNARTILQPTSVDRRRTIEAAIDRLAPEGATNAEAGLRTGYALAERNFRKGATNRVILCSDGVANVGRTGAEDILAEIKRCAGEGIYLTTIGFGMGNYNDVLMEKLADKGDGNYYYVDTLDEARKVFVDHLTGTLEVIARQTKVQVEFDPETVRRYRLIGYENRDVADRDFRNDRVDAGEVGAGHEVTALFEVKLNRTRHDQVATVRIRYEDPETHRVTEEARALDTGDIAGHFERTDPTFRMDAAVAEFAEILRHSYWAKDGNLSQVLGVARDAAREMPRSTEVQDLVQMVTTASRLWPREAPPEWRDDVRPLWEPENR